MTQHYIQHRWNGRYRLCFGGNQSRGCISIQKFASLLVAMGRGHSRLMVRAGSVLVAPPGPIYIQQPVLESNRAGPRYRFFEHLRTITPYVAFQDWPHLLQPIAAAAIRPP
jgi:hypothetical protein